MAIAAICLCVAGSAAQDVQSGLGALSGIIVDDMSGRPIGRAVVSIRSIGSRAVTRENGQFLLADLPMQRAEVKFEADGYVSVVEVVELTDAAFLQIRLDPVAAVLDQILVIAGRRPGDRATPDALSVPAEDRPWQSALDLLEDQVPGIVVRRGGGLSNGAAILIRGVNSFRSDGAPAVYVDGVRIENSQTGPNSIHALDLISAEIVSRIRVVKGAADATAFTNGANGAILIETINSGRPQG